MPDSTDPDASDAADAEADNDDSEFDKLNLPKMTDADLAQAYKERVRGNEDLSTSAAAASSHNSNVSKSTNFTLRSWPPVATRSSHGWNSAHVTAPSCAGSSLSIFPAVRSHSFTAPSNPPLRTHFPSGENRHALTPRSWPLYV